MLLQNCVFQTVAVASSLLGNMLSGCLDRYNLKEANPFLFYFILFFPIVLLQRKRVLQIWRLDAWNAVEMDVGRRVLYLCQALLNESIKSKNARQQML
jgi:hypothetical protein